MKKFYDICHLFCVVLLLGVLLVACGDKNATITPTTIPPATVTSTVPVVSSATTNPASSITAHPTSRPTATAALMTTPPATISSTPVAVSITPSAEAMALYNQLQDMKNNFNFSSIRAEMTGKQMGENNTLIDTSMKVTALLDPKESIGRGHIVAYFVERKEGARVSQWALVDKIYYANQGEGWHSYVDSEGLSVMGAFMMSAPIFLARDDSPVINILPDEKLNGRTVGVLSYEETMPEHSDPGSFVQKMIYRYDKANLLPLKVRIDYGDGQSYQEWQALEYNNPDLKVEVPGGMPKTSDEAATIYTKVKEASFKFSSVRLEMSGSLVYAPNQKEDLKYTLVVPSVQDGKIKSVFFEYLSGNDGGIGFIRLADGTTYEKFGTSWTKRAPKYFGNVEDIPQLLKMLDRWNVQPFPPIEDKGKVFSLLPDELLEGQTVGRIQVEIAASFNGEDVNKMVISYDKNTFRAVKIVQDIDRGGNANWRFSDYDSSDLKIEAPVDVEQ